MNWTGPRESDLKPDGISLIRPVPPERWPYGPPNSHETCCRLHRMNQKCICGEHCGLFCDCKASDASDDENRGMPA